MSVGMQCTHTLKAYSHSHVGNDTAKERKMRGGAVTLIS